MNVPNVPPPWSITLPTLWISSRPLRPYLKWMNNKKKKRTASKVCYNLCFENYIIGYSSTWEIGKTCLINIACVNCPTSYFWRACCLRTLLCIIAELSEDSRRKFCSRIAVENCLCFYATALAFSKVEHNFKTKVSSMRQLQNMPRPELELGSPQHQVRYKSQTQCPLSSLFFFFFCLLHWYTSTEVRSWIQSSDKATAKHTTYTGEHYKLH